MRGLQLKRQVFLGASGSILQFKEAYSLPKKQVGNTDLLQTQHQHCQHAQADLYG